MGSDWKNKIRDTIGGMDMEETQDTLSKAALELLGSSTRGVGWVGCGGLLMYAAAMTS